MYQTTMDFRPCETLFFCDNFLTLGLIGFNFRHEPFQLKRQFLLTRAPLGLLDFHALLGGGVFEHPPPF